MTEFSIRERIVIKLILFLIDYIGKDTKNFFGFKLEECFKMEDKND